VFNQAWAERQPKTIVRFLQASLEAKEILSTSEREWDRIRPLLKAENSDVFLALKTAYRAGILREFGTREIEASKQVFNILAEQGGTDLVGKASTLSDGLFWQNSHLSYSIRSTSDNPSNLINHALKIQ
jgi:NitT/TauT family transport system substrate-binding protein